MFVYDTSNPDRNPGYEASKATGSTFFSNSFMFVVNQ